MLQLQVSGRLFHQDTSRIAWKGGLLEHFWISQRAQWVKALVNKPDTLRSNLGPHGRRRELLWVVLGLLKYVPCCELAHSLCLPVSLTHSKMSKLRELTNTQLRKFSNLMVYKFIKYQNLHLNVSFVNLTAKKCNLLKAILCWASKSNWTSL